MSFLLECSSNVQSAGGERKSRPRDSIIILTMSLKTPLIQGSNGWMAFLSNEDDECKRLTGRVSRYGE